MDLPLGLKTHIHINHMRYTWHINVLAAMIVILYRRAPGIQAVAERHGVLECVASLFFP